MAQDLDQPRAGAIQAQHGHADGAVVDAFRPVGRARVLLERGAHLQDHGDGLAGLEAQPLRVLGIGAGQGLQDGRAQGLVHAAVVADPELRAAAGARRGPRRRRRACAATSGSARSTQALAVLRLRALAVAQGHQGVAQQRPRARVGVVQAHRALRGVARRADVAQLQVRRPPGRAGRAASAGRGPAPAAAAAWPRPHRPRPGARGPGPGPRRPRPPASRTCPGCAPGCGGCRRRRRSSRSGAARPRTRPGPPRSLFRW